MPIGVFGFGRQRPMWGYWAPYWPEKELQQINPNHLLVDVGGVSSDHDRSCEIFYQLVGGRVDYGEQHATTTGHDRYGETFDQAMYPNWSESNPVHLLGHSFGSTTAIELFQMLSADFFRVGSSHKWIASITCIAGPLTGSTLSHIIGMENGNVVHGGFAHLMAIVLGSWLQLYWKFPILKKAANFHMDHWSKYSIKDLVVANGPINSSRDLAVHGTLPEHRIMRNAQLKHMDKLHLLSIATSPKTFHRPYGEGFALALLLFLRWGRFRTWWPALRRLRSVRALAHVVVLCYLCYKLKKVDVSKIPSMYGLKWLIQRRAKSFSMIGDGFEPGSWELNDGVVNIRSMLRPWFPKPQEMEKEITGQNQSIPSAPSLPPTSLSSSCILEDTSVLRRCESHISIEEFRDMEDNDERGFQPKRFEKGRWYVYRVDSNHLAGTYWDSHAPDLYKSLFTLMSKDLTNTKYPIVLLHGVFGYGRIKPFWNLWSPYWPEEALDQLNTNKNLIVELGALSSDHDRACEVFYQLYGGQVDYGEVHSHKAGHAQFGTTYKYPLHSPWSASNPVHLIGHSFGGTTALELYQLICSDFFKVGSNHEWITSLVSIAGPLTGSTMSHLFGLNDFHMVPYSFGHFLGATLGIWFKFYTQWPLLRHVFDFRMPQWQRVSTFREIVSPSGRINRSTDLAVFNLLPRERMTRNAQLIDMDKIFLVSVVTSSYVTIPRVEMALIGLVLVFIITAVVGFSRGDTALGTSAIIWSTGTLFALWRRARALDYASIPSLYTLLLLMRRHVRMLHMIFDGFDRDVWGDNDGAVNLHSMLQPWASAMDNSFEDFTQRDTESTSSTSSSLSTLSEPMQLDAVPATRTVDLHSAPRSKDKRLGIQAESKIPTNLDPTEPVNFSQLRRGIWYVHRVNKNHMAGTHFDSDSPALFQRLFRVMANHFETAPKDSKPE
ncbi:hypothetical protein DD238_005102 [Peronospora effusa]|uniref:Lipase-like C-terminal domain-containing protein n=1 Tax=Peronospora effusa TaxID=542832 RepID=A0A3M6VHF1_9STRA|nr:hypothetical protein DD238_005102 [Peronospora effusa]